MDDGIYIWFGYVVIRGDVVNKHLGDFSCLGTHWLISREKFPEHIFASGFTCQVQDYI